MEKTLTEDQVEQIIRQYLPQVIHMSLGTTADGKPWVCEVHYAYDDSLNFYFRSKAETRHCQDIAANPQVAANIVTQHFLNQMPRGVYLEGVAGQVIEPTVDHPGIKAYGVRFGKGPADLLADMVAKGQALYTVTPTDLYLFDTYASIPPQKYHLPWPRSS